MKNPYARARPKIGGSEWWARDAACQADRQWPRHLRTRALPLSARPSHEWSRWTRTQHRLKGLAFLDGHRSHSCSASRFTAGASGFFDLILSSWVPFWEWAPTKRFLIVHSGGPFWFALQRSSSLDDDAAKLYCASLAVGRQSRNWPDFA